jgi:hypothetical protein
MEDWHLFESAAAVKALLDEIQAKYLLVEAQLSCYLLPVDALYFLILQKFLKTRCLHQRYLLLGRHLRHLALLGYFREFSWSFQYYLL